MIERVANRETMELFMNQGGLASSQIDIVQFRFVQTDPDIQLGGGVQCWTSFQECSILNTLLIPFLGLSYSLKATFT